MQTLNSLYFPQTTLPAHLLSCLLLLPDTMHFLQPVEPDITGETDKATDCDLFMEPGICQAHTPAPLGKERTRFLELIKDIETRKDSYAEQLSALTLANLSAKKDNSEKSHQTIMASLLGGHGEATQEASDDDSRKEELWQARLVLALAERLDKEEAELAASMANIDSDELSLFQDLKGEMDGEEVDGEENPFAELQAIRAKMGQPRPGAMKKRFQSWKTLYGAGPLPENFWFWITTDEEAAELLSTNYEIQSKRTTVPLLLLDIPRQLAIETKDTRDLIKNFQEEAASLRQTISQKLREIISQPHLNLVDPIALLPDAGILARDWNEMIDYHFPEEQFGRQKLNLQFLANIPFNTLLNAPAATQQSDLQHGILAICEQQ